MKEGENEGMKNRKEKGTEKMNERKSMWKECKSAVKKNENRKKSGMKRAWKNSRSTRN